MAVHSSTQQQSATWLIGPISTPKLEWGTNRNGAIHKCPICEVILLTGESPGFCCGPRGSKFTDVPALPPLPDEYNTFINHPDISKQSRKLNLVFSFASLETTHAFPNIHGGPSFVAIEGKIYHRVRPNHNSSAVKWLLHDGFSLNHAPFPNLAVQIPSTWKESFRAALTRVNPLVHSLQNLANLDENLCPQAHLILKDSGTTPEIAAIMSFENTTESQIRSRRLIISKSIGTVWKVPTISRFWEPLAYPLFFPHGTLGWGLVGGDRNTQQNLATDERDVDTPTTQMWHYRARILREERFSIFGRLTNEYLVDMFTRDLETRLNYIRLNQVCKYTSIERFPF